MLSPFPAMIPIDIHGVAVSAQYFRQKSRRTAFLMEGMVNVCDMSQSIAPSGLLFYTVFMAQKHFALHRICLGTGTLHNS
ncbi:MAG: hypothetical protein BCS36_00230 [Desulfovibrio sp. MES5]|nr:MAG: hypothetical protein BCS36_00230 [Desulfovibrio sp. MES5]